ncbi:hypothetical protein ANN_02826 [Periplaneta americana]|uniref:Uncharacterized protein n=1 Tax=Periplaneta americana TaxID=6978 RepID=A0ABQ8TXC9_PERAM|nr:hypothetical protein ANN_02826 [Periplaneta americana]
MSPGSSTESYPAFAHIGLRENPGKTSTRLVAVTCFLMYSKTKSKVSRDVRRMGHGVRARKLSWSRKVFRTAWQRLFGVSPPSDTSQGVAGDHTLATITRVTTDVSGGRKLLSKVPNSPSLRSPGASRALVLMRLQGEESDEPALKLVAVTEIKEEEDKTQQCNTFVQADSTLGPQEG